ncbi:uncharacterized protein LOC106179071 [Lingula anatina]|uniref:Uncharacterized protein LOC106179071 n=1 Tax=Lingula anatina TaxID=7574 RepID=A0A1S3K5X4_LINAN|nr:uncharacterized protein LOC106179071 [Lingula anatina]|eukprot:XP_013418030.2 uncharacterized protein LOC106179071 [Lingula anatina]
MLAICVTCVVSEKVDSAANTCMGIQTYTGKGAKMKKTLVIPPLSDDCHNKLKKAGIIPSMPMCPKENGCTVTYKAVESVRLNSRKVCKVVCPHILHYPKVECDKDEKCDKKKKKHCERDDVNYTSTYRVLVKCPGTKGDTIMLISKQATCCDCMSGFFLDFSSLFSFGKK